MTQIVETTTPGPGVHKHISFDDYVGWEAINASVLVEFSRSALHAQYALTHPAEPTAAFDLGHATHLAILEPERFEQEFFGAEKLDRRTKAGKARWAEVEQESAGRTILREADYIAAHEMAKAVWRHPTARALLSGNGSNELSILWHEKNGTACKARLDRLTKHGGFTWVVDVKTCTDASPEAFARDAARYHYHVKAAYYLHGLNTLAPHQRRWCWIAVEKTPPYGVAVYELDAAALDLGTQLARKYLREYAECERSGKWPGYATRVQALGLPRWVYQAQAGGEE